MDNTDERGEGDEDLTRRIFGYRIEIVSIYAVSTVTLE